MCKLSVSSTSDHHFQEQEKTESEKAELQAKVQEEITRLQENLKRLQQVSQENVVQNRTMINYCVDTLTFCVLIK